MHIRLPELPFAVDDLEPCFSRESVETHYLKHHDGYVKKLNKLIESTPFAHSTLEQIVRLSGGDIFHNAAQVWNHDFYWKCLGPPKDSKRKPSGRLLHAMNERFGSFGQFWERFTECAMERFGSGWAWLVRDEEHQLSIYSTTNEETPLTLKGIKPLLTCDIWEHAYYIDFKSDRAKYIDAYSQLIDWDFVSDLF